jgi:triphosphatase
MGTARGRILPGCRCASFPSLSLPPAPEAMESAPSQAADGREVEWQFDAIDTRPVERWLKAAGDVVTQGETKRLVDTYADTDDWRLYRAGYSLRLRVGQGGTEATMKSLSAAANGLRDRTEIAEPLPAGSLETLPASDGPVGRRVRAVAGSHDIRPKFQVRTRRQTYLVSSNGSAAAEVALDATTIPVEGHEPARLLRVEVETKGGSTRDLADFVGKMRDACGLTPASVSKFEAGLLARGLAPQRSLDLGSLEISSESSVEELAFAVLRKHFAALLRKEGGTRLGEDPEQLHDMRVATRRMRAAIALFEGALPAEVVGLREELGWVASALGAVRDLDVLIQQLEAWGREPDGLDDRALAVVADVLSADRDQARENLVQTLDSPRYERLLTECTAVLRRGPVGASPSSRVPAVDAAPSLIKKRYRKVRKGGRRIDRTSKPAEYHRLRIRAKRLRYALQFLAPIYGRDVRALIRRTVRLQDLLGAHQDAEVAVARFEAIVAEEGNDLPPAAAFAMGEIAERYARRKAKLRRRFPRVFRRVRGTAWADVRRVMNRAGS